MKPVTGKIVRDPNRYRHLDNPMTAILFLWTMSRDQKTIEGLSRAEAVLASLHLSLIHI